MNTIISNMEIELVRKNIKNINLSVHAPEGRIRISAPKGVSDETIRLFIISKLPWIKKQQEKFKNQVRQPQREFVSGESHYFQGMSYLLNVIYVPIKPRAEIREEKCMECSVRHIDLYVRPDSTNEQRQKVMVEWYRKQLKKEIPDLIEKWEPIMGVKVDSWGIKLMKTRWGTCNPQAKRIWINLELAKVYMHCLEYVVVHEMVHLLERYHDDRFTAYMDKFLPDWKSRKEELNNMVRQVGGWDY